MTTATSVKPQDLSRRLDEGALLVCAYADPDKCAEKGLQGAIPLQALQRRQRELPLERELIFYCA